MRKDLGKLERVQKRATRLISEISQLSYEERLQQCRLTTLETRRIRGDQIEVFKIIHGYEGLNKDMFFKIKNDSRTRGHVQSSFSKTPLQVRYKKIHVLPEGSK